MSMMLVRYNYNYNQQHGLLSLFFILQKFKTLGNVRDISVQRDDKGMNAEWGRTDTFTIVVKYA